MEARIQQAVSDLELVASKASDPVRRMEVLEIIARLAHREQAWPTTDELLSIKIKCSDPSSE